MLRAYLKLFSRKLAVSVEAVASRVDHKAVIIDLATRADLSGGYLLMILFSSMVALLGLLTNSVAVVIGAMLISPLMGPIFTAALAFTLGDLRLARKVLRVLVASILLSALVTALFTFLSPLKAPTHEILSRTRPNIYDLLIAAFAGAAGAYALCTRVNYLFVTTGVAVATAVIPPLSVVGYGIGTAQLSVALGGFLLFFTNLVAIVISSDIVFHLFRFRATMAEETRYPVGRRVLILGTILVLISVPLVYTLVEDIRKVKLTNRVEQALKRHLDSRDRSRLTSYSFRRENNRLVISASVNTVVYYNASSEKLIRNDLRTDLKTPIRLDLEQTIVKSGHIGPPAPPVRPPVAPPPPPDTLATLRARTLKVTEEGCRDLEPFFAPYPIKGCGVRFSDRGDPTTVLITLARDYRVTGEEQHWIQVELSGKLNEPVAVEATTVPFLPPVTFDTDGYPDTASRRAMAVLKQIDRKTPRPRLVITAPRGTEQRRLVAALRRYLVKDLGIYDGDIVKRPEPGTEIRVKVIAE